MRTLLVVFGLLVAAPAIADAPDIKGSFGFDYMKPKSSKCAKVTGALLTKLTKSYTCAAVDEGSTASGKPGVADCKAKKGTSQYLLLKTMEDCKLERQTQLDNALARDRVRVQQVTPR